MWCLLVLIEKCKKKKFLRLFSFDLYCKFICYILIRWSKVVGLLDCVCLYFKWYFMVVVNLFCFVDKNFERVILIFVKIIGEKRNINFCLYRVFLDKFVVSYLIKEFIIREYFNFIF